ncbi:MAG: hypothetical protein AB7V44_22670, partial [Pseudonocardia sp.]
MINELPGTDAGIAHLRAGRADNRLVASHVGTSVATTDQEVRSSNPFGRALTILALTSTNGRGRDRFPVFDIDHDPRTRMACTVRSISP